MNETGRNVACPFCSTRYFLPSSLLGAAGAKVRCPNCGGAFVVTATGATQAILAPPVPREGEHTEDRARPGPESPPPSSDSATGADLSSAQDSGQESRQASPPTPEGLAARILDALASERGEALEAAAREGRLFASFGPEILAAYDTYRRQIGRDADPAPFRRALRERWGIEINADD
jgi:predicted Zn finger-like uncharacterized protein